MDGNGGYPPQTAARIVAAAMDAYLRGNLDALASAVHPEAEIEMLLLAGGSARGPSGLREVLVNAQEGIHRPQMTTIEAIADDAAVMIGRIQHMDARGAISDRKAVWLSVLRDGKIWRTRVLASPADAAAVYEELTGRPPAFTT